MISICREEDSFLEDKSVWFVDLSNGERIWMDDDRPGVFPRSAWLRLRMYLEEVQANISIFYIKFRSHLESPVSNNAPGYFFCHKLLANLGDDDIMKSFLIGEFDGKGVAIQEWKTPELIQTDVEYRPLEKVRKECLILNNWNKSVDNF
jgi:hypothetical protein